MRARKSARIELILAESRSVGSLARGFDDEPRPLSEPDAHESASSASSAPSRIGVSSAATGWAAPGRGGRAPATGTAGAGAIVGAAVVVVPFAATPSPAGPAPPVSVAFPFPLTSAGAGITFDDLRAMTFGTATGVRSFARPMRSQREPGWMTSVRERGSEDNDGDACGRSAFSGASGMVWQIPHVPLWPVSR